MLNNIIIIITTGNDVINMQSSCPDVMFLNVCMASQASVVLNIDPTLYVVEHDPSAHPQMGRRWAVRGFLCCLAGEAWHRLPLSPCC